MAEPLSFHFEGALADSHRMNFYESARFQYAAARLMVKLAQFRRHGRFVKSITNASNFNIQLASQTDGSFNINVEDPEQPDDEESFVRISLADLIAYVSERLIGKIDEGTLASSSVFPTLAENDEGDPNSTAMSALDRIVVSSMTDEFLTLGLPEEVRELVKRRAAEMDRERGLAERGAQIERIDFPRSQKLIAMAAPLVSEMATALRRSAKTLEVRASVRGSERTVLFLDQKMAREIETATVDKEITPILGDITQFNKDNGWGKIKIENGTKILSFSVPYDILQKIKQKLIDNMKLDLVYLQTYFVRDRSGEVVRLIAVGVLAPPE